MNNLFQCPTINFPQKRKVIGMYDIIFNIVLSIILDNGVEQEVEVESWEVEASQGWNLKQCDDADIKIYIIS